MLITPAEADRLIRENTALLPAEPCPLDQAHGRVLRAPLKADRDLPPFDRVTMDGYALRAAACAPAAHPADGRRAFRVAGIQAAGQPPLVLADDGACIEIMTGAVLPAGADCVVPYEETSRDGAVVTLAADARPSPGAHLHRRASDAVAGATLVPPGTRLTGREIAVAASVGASVVSVATRPSVAVLATGDELVDAASPTLAAHQLRASNAHALRAALLAGGLVSRADCFHLRDRPPEIEAALRRILADFDVVILTGGVSKGKFDHLPAALAKLGVVKKIHGVAQRPGKPFWFGVSPRPSPVFALPGNPVSAYTCLHRHVLPALARMAGLAPAAPDHVTLSAPARPGVPLAWFLPVALATTPDGRRTATPAPFNTSGDFAGLLDTDGFVELPPAPGGFPAGAAAKFWRWS